MIGTEELFSFELDMGTDENAMPAERLKDTIYNCLDFCLLQGWTPHFYLGGPDPIHHRVKIACDGLTRQGDTVIGNIFEDRLADLWVVSGCGR